MRTKFQSAGLMLAAAILPAASAGAAQVQFSITNMAPQNGLWIMRPWVGIHDGNFNTFTVGQAAGSGVEHIAEDGITGDPTNVLPPPNDDSVYGAGSPGQYHVFAAYPNAGPQTSIGNPTAPGVTLTHTFTVDPNNPNDQFLSFIIMVIPSNDAFFGTPTAVPFHIYQNGLFNNGNGTITKTYSFGDILDAGTEVNTGAADAAFLAQAAANQGTAENGVIHAMGNFDASIVNGSNMFGGNLNTFTQMNFNGIIASVTISEVPEPGSLALLGATAIGAILSRRRRAPRAG